MLKSYLATALKHLTTQKLYTVINVAGLSVGLACFILIGLFVRHELSYDGHWANTDRIYRVSRDYFPQDGVRARVPASANAPIAPALVEDFAEIEVAARLFGGRSEQAGRVFGARALVRRDDAAFYEGRLRFADNEIFEIFDFEWLQGDSAEALAEPNSIVLTRRLAEKYFGREAPLGQSLSLTFGDERPLEVTGVIGDLPENTHLSIDALVSMSTLTSMMGPQMLENWNGSTDYHTYVRLAPGADIEAVRREAPAFLDRHASEEASALSSLTFMNVADIHLHSNRDEEWKPPGNFAMVLSFAVIAVGILLIGCINFMNLSTARASTRAREVAMRKTIGASKAQIVGQFLGESLLLSAIATVLAIALVEIVLPAFRAFTSSALPFGYLDEPALLYSLVGMTIGVGLLAGSYPAFYLSAFRPAKVLKGELTRGGAGVAFRNALVVFQFSIAIALVIGTIVVYQQARFARNLDLGFNKDQIVVLSGVSSLGPRWPTFKEELLDHPGVLDVTASHYTPFSSDDNRFPVRPQGSSSFTPIQIVLVDYAFFETYEIDVLAGRSFSPDFQSDILAPPDAENPRRSAGVIINESAARLLGWSPEAAAGQLVDAGDGSIEATVVGVVKDTHFESVEAAVRPLIFVLMVGPDGGAAVDVASIRVAADGRPQTLDHIDATWHEFLPDQPVARHFLDQDFEALYQATDRQGKTFAAFSLLAVFVACLGLLGLTSFTTEQRTKEVGVRKVMGATVLDIVRLFTGEFSKLVVVANVIAWPAAYFLMRLWLDNFAYRIDLSLLTFAAGGLLALAVALLTVGAITTRAAGANPVHSLRYE